MYSLILLAALSGGADAPANVGGCNGGFGYGAGWGYNGGWDIYGTDFLYTEYWVQEVWWQPPRLVTPYTKIAAYKFHDGLIVTAGDGKLTMTDKDGKNKHMHEVPATASVTLDGKAAKLEDLKEGQAVTVTMKDEKTATIEAKSK